MPPLKDVLTKGLPPGYSPMAPPAPSATPEDAAQTSSSMSRCPLPPTNADADSLRTFQKGSSTPQFRVMPLVPQTGGTTVVTTGGAGTSGSGGGTSSGSSGGSSSTSAAKTVSTIVNIVPNGAALTRITVNRSLQLFSVAASGPCCIRLYGNAAAQSLDVSRPVDAPVPAELTQNIIIDVVLDTTPFFWNTQNIVGFNADTPQGTTLYLTVLNLSSAPISNAGVFITFVPIET
jgi:hypothetical protein